MINLRFHVVSIVAVFLALAVGIVMGSTVVKEGIVENLESRIDSVGKQIDDVTAENDVLRESLNNSRVNLAELAPFAVADRLVGSTVIVLAERGVEEIWVQEFADLVSGSGAEVPVIVWLEPRFSLEDTADADALADALDLTFGDSLRDQALQALAERIATGPSGAESDVLVSLAEEDFVSLEAHGDAGTDDPALLPFDNIAVAILGDPGTGENPIASEVAVQHFVSNEIPALAGEVWTTAKTEEIERGESLRAIIEDEDLGAVASTIDNVEVIEGRIAGVLALAELVAGGNGHYGVGADAEALWPPLPEP